jgi:hypothetical protein
VPKICRWNGIVIEMFVRDHPPAHFHANYAEYEALVAIQSLDVLQSNLPRRVLADVLAWARMRHAELLENAELCRANQLPKAIAPPE